MVKSTLSCLPTNTKLIFNKLVLIKNYTKGLVIKLKTIIEDKVK